MSLTRLPLRCLAAAALLCPLATLAADPDHGILTESSGPQTYSAGPFAIANQTPVILLDTGPECSDPEQPCDSYELTVTLPADWDATHPNDKVKVSVGWTDTGSGQADYDMYIYHGQVDTTDGSQTAAYQGASKDNPEIAVFAAHGGTNVYTIKVVPYEPTGETIHGTIELLSGDTTGVIYDPHFGAADTPAPGVPRYQTFYAPRDSRGNPGNGEFNIGFNPATGHIMIMSSGPTLRLTPPESLDPALPESCEAQWEDVSAPNTDTLAGLDPILWVDQKNGRTFSANSTAGSNGEYAFSDDDGDTWIPAGANPPNGGSDHETIGTGPYPAGSPFAAIAAASGFDNATYYCSQTYGYLVAGPAGCQRSDDGGVNFGPGVLVYEGNGITDCQGLHGHVHVAPDGTVWLPVPDCTDHQGGVISTDAGQTWTQFKVPQSTVASNDPSIAIDKDNTAYYCYANGDGHPHVAVSTDRGATWTRDVDLGVSHGIVNSAFTEAVGGDSGRAACGFIGTDHAGNYESMDFEGVWYAFIATTYDGGQNWNVVNASPGDPVQGTGGVWRHGGSNTNRNLLDFNEITLDDRGRVLYGYDDGCVDTCVHDPKHNSFVAHARVARQTGGKTLYADFDPVEPALPRAACLSATRSTSGVSLSWRAPDEGGRSISQYRIFRGTSAGSETLLALQSGGKTTFQDVTADPAVPGYVYRIAAINALGEGPRSNQISVGLPTAPENPCAVPGITVLEDGAGDPLSFQSNSDLLSFQLSEPYVTSGKPQLYFKLKVAQLVPPFAPNSFYFVSFNAPDGQVHAVRMLVDNSGNNVSFQSYIARPNTSGGVDGRFVQAGSIKPADPRSTFTPEGEITIIVPLADVGTGINQRLTGFDAAAVVPVSLPTGGGAAQTDDEMPDGLGRSGSFMVKGNNFCAPNHPPVAVLSGSPDQGTWPLTVSFDASASYDVDAIDKIASYTFDFGDSSGIVSQREPTITHTYHSASDFPARVMVIDSRGVHSINAGLFLVAVAEHDAVPDAFSFAALSGVVPARWQQSAEITVAGINVGAPIHAQGGAYSVNGGPYSNADGIVHAGDRVRAAQWSANTPQTSKTMTVTIGGVGRDFTVTTSSLDAEPNAFSFPTIDHAAVSTLVTSPPVTPVGFDSSARVKSIGGVAYSIAGGAFTTEPGRLRPGQSIALRCPSANVSATTVTCLVKVGDVKAPFRVRTSP